MRYFLYFSLFFAACSLESGNKNTDHLYFSMDSLVAAQSHLLFEQQMGFKKEVEIAGKKETKRFKAQEINWSSELKIFKSLELNKSSFSGGIDVQSDAKGIIYRAKKTTKIPVKELLIRFDNGKIKTITGVYQDDDAAAAFISRRNFKINFVDGMVRSFEISGIQKMVMTDTATFQVMAEIF
jgi:hypothetical protein